MGHDFWNKLRILVTNKCNYQCPFCHNEGQGGSCDVQTMTFENFKSIIDILGTQKVSELHFSGGEPFLNRDIVKMIQYANENTNWGIGCATNLSLITRQQIDTLSTTRIKFNIQFPFANNVLFNRSTGTGDFDHILEQIRLVKAAGIRIGLNTVIQNNNMKVIKDLILFAIENNLPLKLLPQIGLNGSASLKTSVYPILEKWAIEYHDKGTGATRWLLEYCGKRTTVLYIDAPCFTHNIKHCRSFGELRIHPDMSLQPCIMKKPILKLDLSQGQEFAINEMRQLWNNFKSC